MEDLDEKMTVGGPLIQQALRVLHRYNEVKGPLLAEEIKRLRLDAESLMAAVSVYQIRALGGAVRILH